MTKESVNGNTVSGPQWNYTPALQCFARMINVALIDCRCCLAVAPVSHGTLVALPLPGVYVVAIGPHARPTDEALLARDWIARSESPVDGHARRYLSFPACCALLDVDAERSRAALLATIDSVGDYESEDADARLAALSASEPLDDVEPLFDAPRIVPVLDQLILFVA